MKIGTKIYRFDRIDSTNEFAKTLIDANEGTVVIADTQTCGKGRLGKEWYSPDGGLWFSIVLKPKNKKNAAQLLPLIIGVAICKALSLLSVKPQLKWPNDILIGDKKVAGILAEISDIGIIVGIGLNLNIECFSEALQHNATSLFLETDKIFIKEDTMKLLFKTIEQTLEEKNTSKLLNEWRSYSITNGKLIELKTPTETLSGRALDVDEDGALLIELPTGKIKKIFGGECSIIN